MKAHAEHPQGKNAQSSRSIASFVWAACAVAIFGTAPAKAASVSYFLNQSNSLPDGTNYLEVNINDQGAPGAINFTIQDLASAANSAICDLSGILEFGFNGIDLSKKNILGLPNGWKIKHDKKISGFGKYENVLVGNNWDAVDTLSFSIVGIQADSLSNYISSYEKSDGYFFGADVGGIAEHGKHHDCSACSKNVYFAGGVVGGGGTDPTPVPVPAALWLFGSGLLGLAGITGRKKS
ncbi:MAG: VPLPA-CTERM sorting domain-containing protein [Sulfuricaulis sp.]